jgi:threonine/homoserine/homoserine lactone efflux protein
MIDSGGGNISACEPYSTQTGSETPSIMSTYGLLPFIAVFSVSVVLPGPGVAAVVARALARGMPGTGAFIAGMTLADLLWFTCAATGLAALAQRAHTVFLVVKFGGVAYLLYLAWRLWATAPANTEITQPTLQGERTWQLFAGGVAFTLSNPKAIVFFLALLPTVVQLERLTYTGYLQIALCIALIVPLILGSYALAAARARNFFASQQALRRLQRGTGVVMAGAAMLVAVR